MNINEEFRQQIIKNEAEANKIAAKFVLGIAVVYVIFWILYKFGIFWGIEDVINTHLLGNSLILLVISLICLKKEGKGAWQKYVLILMLLVSVVQINLLSGNTTLMLYAVPIALTCRYFNQKLTFITGIASAFTLVLSTLLSVLWSSYTQMIDLSIVQFDLPTTLDVQYDLYDAVIKHGFDHAETIKTALLNSAFPNMFTVLIMTCICTAMIKKGQDMISKQVQEEREKAKLEVELANSRTRIMISQIQPHFLYNTLSAIMAIDGNPDETIDALGEFGKYLRENLNTLTASDLTPFDKEMQHVKRYVSLEQLRFGENVKVIYDIKATGFEIPTLTVQMLVENAIKHGITKKENGGTVCVKSIENEDEYFVAVTDDGIGFDPSSIPEKEDHVGLKNIQYRLHTLCDGKLKTMSTIGEGTTQIVRIPKKRMEK